MVEFAPPDKLRPGQIGLLLDERADTLDITATIIDLARQHGYRGLPTEDPQELAAWIRRGADRKSLELYLETFEHTVGVMQESDAIERVAAECAEDLAADVGLYWSNQGKGFGKNLTKCQKMGHMLTMV